VHRSVINESTVLYEHRESTRRPIVAVAALLGALMTTIGWRYSAPGPFIAVISITTLFCVWFFVLGRHSGCRVDQKTALFFAGNWKKSIPILDVASYRLTSWSESQDWIHLRVRDGHEWLVPAYCVGDVNDFVAILDRLHIARES
jgi:hypothetical protein